MVVTRLEIEARRPYADGASFGDIGPYERLDGTGPIWVRMYGSGSAVAAIYKKEGERDEAAARLGTKGHALIKTMTRSSPAAY